jgi:hypothetical protein
LTKRPEQIQTWDTLSADQKRLYARMMEVYAGALSHADYNIGRLLDAVEHCNGNLRYTEVQVGMLFCTMESGGARILPCGLVGFVSHCLTGRQQQNRSKPAEGVAI